MRKTYVLRDGKLVEKGAAPARNRAAPEIMPDIKPYRSTITQELITSRSKHRQHLRQHNCEEIGSETPAWLKERQREQRERNGR